MRVAPSPRTASETRNDSPPSPRVGLPPAPSGGTGRTRGRRTSAPARRAAAMPSPVATVGFVVCAYSSPAPPVASTTASAVDDARGARRRAASRHPPHVADEQLDAARRGRRRARGRSGTRARSTRDVARAQPRDERLLDRGAGGVAAGVQDARVRVRRLETLHERAVRAAVERHAEGDRARGCGRVPRRRARARPRDR